MSDYTIEFYEDRHGFCPIAEWLRGLDQSNSKLNKSMLKKVYFQLERLAREGPLIGEPIVKKLDSEIWELRPIPNRVFFAVMKDKQIVILHHYRKKSQRTPDHELAQARREFKDWQVRSALQ